jgi:hypothetical protein
MSRLPKPYLDRSRSLKNHVKALSGSILSAIVFLLSRRRREADQLCQKENTIR